MASRSAWLVATTSLVMACAGSDGKNGAPGTDGAQALVVTMAVEPGAECPAGGDLVRSGLDANGDGKLQIGEIKTEDYVCNGEVGSDGTDGAVGLVDVTTLDQTSQCPAGGQQLQAGLDADGNGKLEGSEVTTTRVVCNGADGAAAHQGDPGANSLIATHDEPAGTKCSDGGKRIEVGVDANGDAILSADEVAQTSYVCNGLDGANGATGAKGSDGADGRSALMNATAEPAGANCPTGGYRIQSGLDTDGDGSLQADEVKTTDYVCNGEAGAIGTDRAVSLIGVTTVDPGSECATGGQRLEAGLDTDANGTLDPGEVTTTRLVCNGANGAAGVSGTDGKTALVNVVAEAAGPNCAQGGQRIDSGVDSDANGSLDPGEVTATQYVCDGAPGANPLANLSCNEGDVAKYLVSSWTCEPDAVLTEAQVDAMVANNGYALATDLANHNHDATYVNEGQADSIVSSMIVDGTIQSSDIHDSGVTLSDLESNSVDSSKVVDNSLTASDLAASSVTASELAANSVDSSKILDDTIGRSDIKGTEVGVYLANSVCGATTNNLTFDTWCTSQLCSAIPVRYYSCTGTCDATNPQSCSNSLVGYLLAPSI